MNRKQWLVSGIGLILLGLFFGVFSGTDCSSLQSEALEKSIELSELGVSLQDIHALNNEAWVISCLNTNITMATISTIIFTLGGIFVILGFLEPKKK